MKLEDIDALNNNPYPQLAEAFYNIYSSSAIDLLINTAHKAIEHAKLLHGERIGDLKKVYQTLKMEMIAKFCHYAESLAAISIAFSYTFENEQDEMVGTYNIIAKYTVNQCLSFYKNIETRDVKDIAKFLGYPPLGLQDSENMAEIVRSSNAARNHLKDIGQYYLTLFEIYDAYKHCYRILFGTRDDTGLDARYLLNSQYPFNQLCLKIYFTHLYRDQKCLSMAYLREEALLA